jgi:hypothetical protein
MSTIESPKDLAGYLAEYNYIRETMRQDQRERQGFLAFSLAASGLILGLLMRSTPPRSATEVCFLVGMAAGVLLVAEQMTLRAAHAISSGGTYIGLFIEPHVEGLDFQRRYPLFVERAKGSTSASRSFAFAYCTLTTAFILAWLAAPVHDERQWWQTVLVATLGIASLTQVWKLMWIRRYGWKSTFTSPDTTSAWSDIRDQEQQTTNSSDQ